MKVLSLGAGVQSSTLALMAAAGEIERPDFAVFADTGWEPRAVYEWLDSLEPRLTYPLVRVSRGNIRADLLAGTNATGQRFASVPYYLQGAGIGRRQCTREYKVEPITREIRSRRAGGEPVELWIGISLDEVQRMKPNRVKWIINRWPLIERRMTRQDCIAWLSAHGYSQPPKSSCIGCPFHDNAYWRRMKDETPDEWDDAVLVDKVIRRKPGMRAEQYTHRSLVPLDKVDLSTPEDHGQLGLWAEECEGMCGV